MLGDCSRKHANPAAEASVTKNTAVQPYWQGGSVLEDQPEYVTSYDSM